jgi:hypothetical protein
MPSIMPFCDVGPNFLFRLSTLGGQRRKSTHAAAVTEMAGREREREREGERGRESEECLFGGCWAISVFTFLDRQT